MDAGRVLSTVLIVSPHRDDAAFSCGIVIRELRKVFSVVVANFFTVSEYAPFRASESGSVTEVRLREDEAFAGFAGVELLDLNLVDAPQRLSMHVSDLSTPRPLDTGDSLRRITEHVRTLVPNLILLPLAIGDHIDHRIARAGATNAGCVALAFYEDLPYCSRVPKGASEVRAGEMKLGLTPLAITSPGGRAWKRQCAGFYPSQVEPETMDEIADFSDRYQEGERLWITEAAAALLRLVVPR